MNTAGQIGFLKKAMVDAMPHPETMMLEITPKTFHHQVPSKVPMQLKG